MAICSGLGLPNRGVGVAGIPSVLLLVPGLLSVRLGQLGLWQVKGSCLKVAIDPLAVSLPGKCRSGVGVRWGHSHKCAPQGDCSGPLGSEVWLPACLGLGGRCDSKSKVKALSLGMTAEAG